MFMTGWLLMPNYSGHWFCNEKKYQIKLLLIKLNLVKGDAKFQWAFDVISDG